MGYTLAQKIIKSHLIEGEMQVSKPISIKIDQTLTQDSTGTMAYLQLEAVGIDRVKTKKSVAYIDHNMIQAGPENADDHAYIQSIAKKYGIYFSKPGNGICHQVHLERFSTPGETLLGSDSHTPTCGAMAMLAIGAGGLDVAVAMAGGAYCISMPSIVKVELKNKLKKGCSAKDIILEVLRRYTVKGGVNKIFEYVGDGVENLSVPERATITNMGAELGATTSIFPSDKRTLEFLKMQSREEEFKEIYADDDAIYQEEIVIYLDKLKPLVACPDSPDKVVEVDSIKDLKIDQVAIGSCTNSSYMDMMKVANILKNNTIAENVSLVIAPGSKQVLNALAKNGALAEMIQAGARILESACGPCIGMGQAPKTNAISLRTFNRNFKGRSGTKDSSVYLVSPEIAAASALKGFLVTADEFLDDLDIDLPDRFEIKDNLIIKPTKEVQEVEIQRGPNIKPFPKALPIENNIKKKVLIKLDDNITTDHIMPSNAHLLPFRSNIPYLANFCLSPCDSDFPKRALEEKGGIIVAGHNYGQGSSREHAALAPLYLGIKVVIAKGFARIHKQNLINNGIIALEFQNENDYKNLDLMDELEFENIRKNIFESELIVFNKTKNKYFSLKINLSQKQREMILAGGLLNQLKL